MLGCVGLVLGRGDAEVTAFVFVEESAEDGRRVKVWPVKLLGVCRCNSSFGRACRVRIASIELGVT